MLRTVLSSNPQWQYCARLSWTPIQSALVVLIAAVMVVLGLIATFAVVSVSAKVNKLGSSID
jgi:hypothetical protein